MEPLPAAPPARGTSRGYNPERPSPVPSARPGPANHRAWKGPRRLVAAFRPRPFPLPGRPRTAEPGLPARRGPGSAGYLRGAAPLFVERRAWDLLPRRRQRPASRRPPTAPGSAPSPPPAAPHVLSRAAEGRTVAAAAPRSPPGAASPGDTFPASVGRRPAARPSTPAAGPECRPEACSGHDTLPAGPPRPPGRRVLSGPRLCFPPSGLRDAPGHSWAEAPPLNRPPLCQVILEGDG